MASTDSPARPWPVNFHVSACVDAPDSGPVLEAFDRTLSDFAPFHKAGWKFEMRTLPPPRLYDAERRSMQEPLFVRMDVGNHMPLRLTIMEADTSTRRF